MHRIVLLFLMVAGFGNSARILGIVPTPSFSHQVAFHPIWENLAKRGHEVVLFTTDPIKNSSLKNLTQIDLHPLYDVLVRNNAAQLIKDSAKDPIGFYYRYTNIKIQVTQKILENQAMQKLITNEKEHFDLVMVEVLYPPFLSLGHVFKCPTIGIVSMDAPAKMHYVMGNPAHAVAFPDLAVPFDENLNFFERFISAGFQIFLEYFRRSYSNVKEQEIIDKYFPGKNLEIETLLTEVSMLFTNVNPIFSKNRPLGPNTISFGGSGHLKTPKPLSKDLVSFLDSAPEGVVYMSLGSNVKSKDLDERIKTLILEVFQEIPYKVLWKFEDESVQTNTDSIKLVKWTSQQDVLRHPNVKVFITQCGLQSLDEAIFTHVPMVALPFFGDQESNAKKMAKKGMGVALDPQILTKSQFKEAILEVLTNNKYRESVEKLAEFAEDQPMTGTEKAIWWTEYVIRHKGAEKLKNPIAVLPLYQYYYLDIFGFLLTVVLCVLIILFVAFKVVAFSLRKICKQSHSKKAKLE